MERSRLGIVIPAYNEAKTIAAVVSQSLPEGIVIVVNDSSSDETAMVAERAGAVVVTHETNRGYDGALRSGFAKAAALGCAAAVTVDADGQHDPRLIRAFSEALDDYPLVLGVRNKTQRISEAIFAWVAKRLYGMRDPLCGMKGYHLSLHRELGHFDSYGSIGTELALFALKRGVRFKEIPLTVRERLDAPRFGSALRANLRILRALGYGVMLRPAAAS